METVRFSSVGQTPNRMKMKHMFLWLFVVAPLLGCEEERPSGTPVFTGGDVKKHAPVNVEKSNSMKVYMHYMPWFDSPEYGGNWGIHWTMSSRSPNVEEDGKRQIASHYYPLIGPYDSQDPHVIEYHLLLMKYAGIDGVLINWYGVEGTNGDIGLLLENSEAIIGLTDEVGVQFGVVLEDRFSAGIEDAKANVAYLGQNYYSNKQYIQFNNRPLTLIFGPITIQSEANWTNILGASTQDEVFMPLWYNQGAGGAAAGQYAWVYRDALSGLRNFYLNTTAAVVGGAAYPGFRDYYAEGGWEESSINWEIPVGAATLRETLDLAKEHQSRLDFLQLITWNDFGEGTMIEPTVEFEFTFLQEIQAFTGVGYGLEELELIHELYLKRKENALVEDRDVTKKLDQIFYNLVALKVSEARDVMAELD